MSQTRRAKKQRDYLLLQSKKLANSWWGVAWNKNLESYSDFSNRLPRARTYLRQGRVFNLSIEEGVVNASVQGSRRAPYKITIIIEPLSEEKVKIIQKRVNRQIENIDCLIKGEFPATLADLFFDRKTGLFPSPKEIRFHCSCPDWAYLCKHVGAVLYGIGATFDTKPLMFFALRGIDMNLFIKQGLEDKLDSLLKKAKTPSKRILSEQEMSDLFGV